MDEVQLTRRLRMLESIENAVCAVLATAVAGLYFWYRYEHGVIATFSWSIPFLVVGGVSKFAFALAEGRIEAQLRAGREPAGLPGARIVRSDTPHAVTVASPPRVVTVAPPPRAVTPMTTVAPQPAPPAPGQEPSLLK